MDFVIWENLWGQRGVYQLSGSSKTQSFSGEEEGVEGGEGRGAGRKKPVMVVTSFALLSWNSLEGLKQDG